MSKITILFVPINSSGHINPSIGLAEKLREHGHHVVFAVDKAFQGKTGFEEKIYNQLPASKENLEANQFFGNFAKESSKYLGRSSEIAYNFMQPCFKAMLDVTKHSNNEVKKILAEVKPNVIIKDNLCLPSLVTCGVPVVPFFASNPLTFIDDERLPPGFSGFPVNDNSKWNHFRELKAKAITEIWTKFNEWVQSLDAPPLEPLKMQHESQILNIYMFPEDIDYTDIRPLGSNWFRIDCFDYSSIRNKDVFVLPKHLQTGPGKLIYFSMGSFGSANVDGMKRITGLLSKTQHRFIVSKGPCGDEYELPENMCGDKYVPQLIVLQMVDLAIIHGGNNSLLECLYFGKPMIILPLFADQYDNGQRVKEMDIGSTHLPFDVTAEQLINDINRLTSDNKINEKLARISKNLQNSKSLDEAAKRIEQIGQQHLKQSI